MFDIPLMVMSISPERIAMVVSLAPRYGTCTRLIPAMPAKYSVAMRWIVPGPVVPYVIVSGFCFASAISSFTFDAGTLCDTASMCGIDAIRMIGSSSFIE